MSLTSLQRKVLSLEASERKQAEVIEEQRLEIERLRGERKVLYDGEVDARQSGEEREKELMDDRVGRPHTASGYDRPMLTHADPANETSRGSAQCPDEN